MNKEHIYNKTWLVVLFLIIIPPLGVVFLWINDNAKLWVKITLTVAVTFAMIYLMMLFTGSFESAAFERLMDAVNRK